MRAPIRALAAFSLASFLSVGTQAGDPRRVQAFLQKGIKALEEGELAKAEKMFQQAQKVDPGFPQPEVLLGQLDMARSQYDAAEIHFLKAIELHVAFGERVEGQQRLIDARLQLDAMERDIDKQHSKSTGGSADLQREVKQIRLSEQVERAERDKWESIEDGIPPDLFVYVGNARMYAGRPAAAAEAYRDAARRAPDRLAPHHNLAVALLQAEQPEEALSACRRALGMDYAPSSELCPQIEKKLADRASDP